jgi:CubicO group peptidase (beta-lactamase class C family)
MIWTTCWSALLGLSVLLLAPTAAQAGDNPSGHIDAPTADFQTIDAYVTSQMDAMHIPGVAVGIVQGDRIVHLQGFGVANPAGQAMTAQTPLILGSTNKSFTGLAIMQLAEAGRISLDAPVQEYLPWFDVDERLVPGAASTITVRHLLNQTSGIPTGKSIGASLTADADETPEQAVRALKDVAVTSPAGTTFQYSNSNYVILGLLVQTVSGQSYESYVQEHIFTPLHMQHSFVSEREAMRHEMATGYRWWFGLPVPANLPHSAGAVPAGYLISSAQDMAQYLVAQLNEGRYLETSVLSPAGIAELHDPAAPMDPDGARAVGYGMGWAVRSSGEPLVWHDGDTPNFHSDMTLLPARQLGVVVLMNVNGNLAIATNAQGVIAQGVQQLLLGQQPPEESGFQRRYMLFDAALVICSSLVIWSLVRLLRRRKQPPRQGSLSGLASLALPLLWEMALPLGLLISFPSLAQASWPLTLLFFPDLGYWLLALCAMLLATGSLRLVLARHPLAALTRLQRSRRQPHRSCAACPR